MVRIHAHGDTYELGEKIEVTVRKSRKKPVAGLMEFDMVLRV